jgi:quercetin dioxygenase-like cupin family protein
VKSDKAVIMRALEVKNAEINENPHKADARTLYSTEKAMIVHIMLKPGESLKRHITPADVAFYVLEGKGIIETGEERKEVGPDMIIESLARIPHRWINEGSGVFRVLKLPRPTESTRIL